MSIYNPISPVRFALKIRSFAQDSYFVYRYEMGHHGLLNPVPRIVFYAACQEQAQQWVIQQQKRAPGCVTLHDPVADIQ